MALLVATAVGCSSSTPPPTAASTGAANKPRAIELLNVSYDPTRELYRDINTAFAKHYEQEHGTAVTIKQSHAASGSQSRAVIDGLDADVVTLATWPDVEAVAKSGLLRPDWQNRYENRS
ncbi:MAG: substrate-binding domain-containing protein, partial [Planctomycetia bacterium]